MQRGSGNPDHRTAEEVDDDLGRVLGQSVRLSRRNRTWVRWLAVSITFDVIFSCLLAAGYLRVQGLQHDACARDNRARRGEQTLWGNVLKAPVASLPANATTEQRAKFEQDQRTRAQFTADLHRYFGPVDC
jgi:hypothetical protein